jgi:hypothetical protein
VTLRDGLSPWGELWGGPLGRRTASSASLGRRGPLTIAVAGVASWRLEVAYGPGAFVVAATDAGPVAPFSGAVGLAGGTLSPPPGGWPTGVVRFRLSGFDSSGAEVLEA